MVRTCTRNHPWATFGNDMLLGIKADLKTDQRQQDFLPDNLMYDVDRATIYANGEYRPLVRERRIALQAGVQIIEQDFPLTPTECACLLLIVSVVIAFWEWKRRLGVETPEGLQILGCAADARTGIGGLRAVRHDLLAAPHHKPEPPAVAVESPALLLHPRCAEAARHQLVEDSGGDDCAVRHRRPLPALCRGDDDCGTMFARVFNGYKIRTK